MRSKRSKPGPQKAQKPQKHKYSATLLFQFRVVTEGRSDNRRLCEDRIIVFNAGGAKSALRHANARGRAAQHSYKNGTGGRVHFEFIGVTDLLELGVECEPDEVWYDLIEMVRPMERKRQLVPRRERLRAFQFERELGKRKRTV